MKPSYRVPLMPEINALPWNGFKAASTFSGCGGSCLGYRMAGFKVVWANEFVPAAQASYKANAASDCILDCRDIRQVKPDEILSATGLKQGELDLFDGSPPCQAFSTAGKREKGWGKGKRYEHGAVQCNETLFDEYIRLLRGLMPKVFIAENVSGLVKGTAKGYFLEILAALKGSGYRVEAKLLDAQWLGVPQMRQRIIFQGVRNDLKVAPSWPKPFKYRYSVRDALGVAFRTKGYTTNNWTSPDGPAACIHNGQYQVIHDESGQWSEGDITEKPAPTGRSGRAGTMFIEGANGFNGHAFSSEDQPLPTVQAGRPLNDVERPLPPSRKPGTYGVQEVSLAAPCPTVTTASPSNDLAGNGEVIARRKFTIAELKRVCAFPDDFILVGSYAQQWERLGNSVPPLMMKAIAEAVRDKVLQSIFDNIAT